MTSISNEIPTEPSAIYLSHGGGPLPVLGDPDHREMVEHLRAIAAAVRRPAAIIVVSAHWEEPVATITAHASPPLVYDYCGFPAQSYELRYPAPGAPTLARELRDALARNGFEARLDRERGFDHGLFVPLLLMYPEADIPCVQLSLLASLDARDHIGLGRAISPLAGNGVLVIGSGFSFHNLGALLHGPAGQDPDNEAFEAWLIDTCSNPALDEAERTARLVHWDSAPAASYCHPRPEHLLPLHVCYGVGGRACSAHAALTIMKKKASTYFWRSFPGARPRRGLVPERL